MSASLTVTNRLGMKLSVAIEGDTDPLDVARHWAKRGWRSVNVPPRGFKLPLIMSSTFDWDLLGAREDTIDGVPGVWFDGMFYKRRDLAANPRKQMEACVKYSRGFRSSVDDPALAEGDEDGFQYVTLVMFRGGSMPIREFERRSAATQPRERTHNEPRGEARADAIARGELSADDELVGRDALQWIVQYAATHQIDNAALQRTVQSVTNNRTDSLTQVSVREARAIAEKLKQKGTAA